MKPALSLLVPAHNEERVIGRCLTSALNGLDPSDIEIAVVCNGCSDGTAERARQVLGSRGFRLCGSGGGSAQVLELAAASKVAALNAGDSALTIFPRVYLDADVELAASTLLAVAHALDGDEAMVASPAVRFAVAGRPWAVRAFYRVWQQTPYLTHGLIGNGVYALSASGRGRFEQFPALTADDLFVQRLFTPQERKIVKCGHYTVHVPRTVRDLVKVRTRVYYGNAELEREGFGGAAPVDSASSALLRIARRSPRNWPALASYVAINAVGKLRATRRQRSRVAAVWDRDESSRQQG